MMMMMMMTTTLLMMKIINKVGEEDDKHLTFRAGLAQAFYLNDIKKKLF